MSYDEFSMASLVKIFSLQENLHDFDLKHLGLAAFFKICEAAYFESVEFSRAASCESAQTN